MFMLMTGCLAFTFCSCTDPSGVSEGGQDSGKNEGTEIPDEGTGETENPTEPEKWFIQRGLVASWSDVSNSNVIDYISIAKANGINTFSIFGANRTYAVWKEFAARCQEAGIDLEYEEHMMSYLLPRDLFSTHPEYFRMDASGKRVNDANGCPSSEGALEEIRKNAKVLALDYAPTNDKYYFWLDDGGDICHCDKCKGLNYADQALTFENAIIEAVKEINPDAKVAHLCYAASIDPPVKVTPHKDIFLEFAPFYRSMEHPLSAEWAVGRYSMTHSRYLRALAENLEVFPAETAQVLEYWMDDSLFSEWNPADLVEVPWDNEMFLDDIDTYASYGIRNIMCYSVYVGPSYVYKFGYPAFLEEYGQGLLNYEKK